MTFRLIQLCDDNGERCLAALGLAAEARRLSEPSTTYDLARLALDEGLNLATAAERTLSEACVDLQAASREGRLLPPIDHADPAHLMLTGTGLTHLGSAEGRDQMHRAATSGAQTDSMRMFQMGMEGGKPADGCEGVQPEWFYKGDGSSVVASEQPLISPDFAKDGSEEPEIAGIYIVDAAGQPHRLGFCLANEFSDHVTERGNYLWLAHSKLRPAALGAELLTGPLPSNLLGMSKLIRDGAVIWQKPFLTGEENMSHSVRNLEHHHFKYQLFRRPGDVHVHFFGTATLSFSDGIRAEPGDQFEISAPGFSLPLRNWLVKSLPVGVEIGVL